MKGLHLPQARSCQYGCYRGCGFDISNADRVNWTCIMRQLSSQTANLELFSRPHGPGATWAGGRRDWRWKLSRVPRRNCREQGCSVSIEENGMCQLNKDGTCGPLQWVLVTPRPEQGTHSCCLCICLCPESDRQQSLLHYVTLHYVTLHCWCSLLQQETGCQLEQTTIMLHCNDLTVQASVKALWHHAQ